MRRLTVLRRLSKPTVRFVAAVGVVTIAFILLSDTSQAALLTHRGFALTSTIASATANYTMTMQVGQTGPLGSIQVVVCSNSPLINDVCSAPAGFDLSHATLTSQVGPDDFSILSQTANTIIFSRVPGSLSAGQTITFDLAGVVNPNAAGSYYGRLYTYASNDASGANIDFGGLAFEINSGLQLSTIVPPFLAFCSGVQIVGYDCSTVTGDYLNLGNLSSNTTRTGQTQMLVATNAPYGYSVQAGGSTLLSGNNVISAMGVSAPSQTGVAQFGINLRANSTPQIGADPSGPGLGSPTAAYNIPNRYAFITDDIIAQSLQADDYRKYTVSYVVNIPISQPAGVYISTITYVCTGNF